MDKLPSPDYPPGKPAVSIRKLHPKKVKLLKHPIYDSPFSNKNLAPPRLPGL